MGRRPTVVIFHNGAIGVTRVRLLPAGIVKWSRFPNGIRTMRRVDAGGHSVLLLRFGAGTRAQVLAAHVLSDALTASNGGIPRCLDALALWGASRLGIAKRMLLVHHAASAFGIGRQTFERLLDRAVQRWATDLVTVSRATRETLIRIRHFDTERNPIRVIHNGIAATSAPAAASDLRGRWQVAPGEFLVGMIGRIERYKGHEDVLLALAELPDTLRGRIRLVIVGTGHAAELERLRSLSERLGVADRVVFAGFVDTESRAIVQQFDLLVMATKDFEGFDCRSPKRCRSERPFWRRKPAVSPNLPTTTWRCSFAGGPEGLRARLKRRCAILLRASSVLVHLNISRCSVKQLCLNDFTGSFRYDRFAGFESQYRSGTDIIPGW